MSEDRIAQLEADNALLRRFFIAYVAWWESFTCGDCEYDVQLSYAKGAAREDIEKAGVMER
jgi:hypothetical protein